MAGMEPLEMAARIGGGLLSFPVTHFGEDFGFREEEYRSHCAWLLEHDVAGLFAAGGTGEFFSLTPYEVQKVVAAAVAETAGRVPVVAGCGYGTAIAVDLARRAEAAGADGLLLLPPYLVNSKPEGLAAHVESVCRATKLGVIVYNRDNAILDADTLAGLCERNANLVGFKDGVGDIELMMRVFARMGDRPTYSSAVFNFMPEWALSFYGAVRARDRETVLAGLRDFILPYVELRNRGRGYAVSIVKAGMKIVGRDAGPVRSPLTDLDESELETLRALIEAAQPEALRSAA